MREQPVIDIVIPTVGRASLGLLLGDLAAQDVAPTGRVVVVDDRPSRHGPLALSARPSGGGRLDVHTVATGGRGPAFARNAGWVSVGAPWVAFLDDDVRVPPDWFGRLVEDVGALGDEVAASQGRVHVPMPTDRPPTDRERDVGGLSTAAWITADLVVRRDALVDVGGFDGRFRRAFREDADLAIRLRRSGWQLSRGRREVVHPVVPAPWWISVSRQRGNADDARMLLHHGPEWRREAEAGRGTRRRHALWCLALVTSVLGPRRARAMARVIAIASWLRLWRRRTEHGPRDLREIASMGVTSLAIPPVAVWWWLRGLVTTVRERRGSPLEAVLFDRDGTLIEDVPYNADPERVRPRPVARRAVERARSGGVAVGVVSNQSGVARGRLTTGDVLRVNERVAEELGPFQTWRWCPHGAADDCTCRKPRPGLVLAAADDLGVEPARVAVVGDIGSDVDAADAAGALGVLVPGIATRPSEINDASLVMARLDEAVELLLLEPGHGVGPDGRGERVS